MNFSTKISSALENTNKYLLTPLIVVLTGVVGIYTAITKNQLEEQSAQMAQETAKIENAAKSIETELAEKEFDNNLRMQMFSEVKDAISDTSSKTQMAVLTLVNEMLADDSSFRDRLITILLASSQVHSSVKEEQQKMELREQRFQKDMQDTFSVFTVDILYTDSSTASSEKVAGIVSYLKEQYPSYDIRKRCLPREINARKAFRYGGNELRYNAKDSSLAAGIRTNLLTEKLIPGDSLTLRQGIRPGDSDGPRNYMSLFIRKSSAN